MDRTSEATPGAAESAVSEGSDWFWRVGPQAGPEPAWAKAYGELIESLREFLDRVSAARPDAATARALSKDLGAWSRGLRRWAVDERERVFARQPRLRGHGGAMTPCFEVLEADDNAISGVARFGRWFLGANGAAHGGAIPLLLDDVIGRLANAGGRPIARTASLKTDYRSITPIERDLSVRAWFVREEGRKRVLRAEIRDGERLCAEAECLLVTLRPGQP